MSTSKIIPIEIDDIMETQSKQRGIIPSSLESGIQLKFHLHSEKLDSFEMYLFSNLFLSTHLQPMKSNYVQFIPFH